ncbi:hypothetical protein [Actinophytocola xanthii]|nr:hypothetical protein [Actinophytocola xanthii]
MRAVRQMWSDVRAGRNLDAYVVTMIAAVFAALGVIGDLVPEALKWSAVFAALALLLFRITLPAAPAPTVDGLLADRDEFVNVQFTSLLRDATQLWIFAPSAINLLNPQHCTAIRELVLVKGTGDVRVAVLDPDNEAAVALGVRQLDESLQYPVQDLRASLSTSVSQLRRMSSWQVAGNFAYRFVDYNPGFSIVAINPTHRDGRIVVEFHGYRNEATGSRMHITLTRRDSDRWFRYWAHQFEELWSNARLP